MGKNLNLLFLIFQIIVALFFKLCFLETDINLFYFSLFILVYSLFFYFSILLKDNDSRFNPFLILSFIYSISFSGSVVNCLIEVLTTGYKWSNILSRFEIHNYNVFNAIIYSLLFSFFLFLYSQIINNKMRKENFSNNLIYYFNKHKSKILTFSILIVFCHIVLIWSGKVSLQGEVILGKNLSNIEVNPLVAIILPISFFPVFASAFYLREKRNKLLVIILLIEFIWYFLWGRRSLLYFFYNCFIGYYFSNIITFKFLLKKLFPISLSVLALILFMNIFNYIRLLGGVEKLQELNWENITYLYEKYNTKDFDIIKKLNQENRIWRPLTPLGAVAYYENLSNRIYVEKGMGLEIYNSFLKSTPSNFFVKDKNRVYTMEYLLFELSNGKTHRENDLGDTLIFESFLDFGLLGILIYPAIIFLLFLLFLFLIHRVKLKLMFFFYILAMVNSFLTLTEGGIGVLFLFFRSIVVIIPIVLILNSLKPYVIKRKII